MEEFFIDVDGVELHAKIDKPVDFVEGPLLILLHGFTGHMEERHITAVQQAANEVGCAVLRVELYGHGKSGGSFGAHTIFKWINNVLGVIDYAKGLPWATKLYLAGHSQGGWTTILVAGMRSDDLAAIISLSPAIVIEDAAREGSLFGMAFDPAHVPDRLYMGGPVPEGGADSNRTQANEPRFLDGDYFRTAQLLHANESIDRYPGPVLIVQGTSDESVPCPSVEEAAARYANARLVLIEGDTHCYDHHLDQVLGAVKEFLIEQV